MMFQIHFALGVSLCFVCISKTTSDDDSAVRLRALQNTLSGRRRMRPLPRKSSFEENVILLDEQSILDDNNETLNTGDQGAGDNDTNEQGYSNQLSLSMSYSLSISSTSDSKKSKKSKSSKSTDATKSPSSATTSSKKSKSPKTSPAEPPGSSTTTPTSKKSKGSKKAKSTKIGIIGIQNRRIYKGRYKQLREYKKSCSSSGSCNQSDGNFCKGGMDIVQDFAVPNFGNVTIHLDIAWDFAGRRSKCAPVSRNEETLLGLGWIPMSSNSYVCYAESVYRIPKSPDLNDQVFSSTFQVTMQDGQVLDGHILSGAVCELYSASDEYLEMNSYLILASVPGYSVYVRYVIDERTIQVVDFLSGASHISIQQEDSSSTGYLDNLRPDVYLLQGL